MSCFYTYSFICKLELESVLPLSSNLAVVYTKEIIYPLIQQTKLEKEFITNDYLHNCQIMLSDSHNFSMNQYLIFTHILLIVNLNWKVFYHFPQIWQ